MLRKRPQYAGEIWKRSVIALVRPIVHTDPSRHHSLSKIIFKRRNLKTPAFCFRVDGKHFENGIFRKRSRYDNRVISLTEYSWNTNPKRPVIVAFLNFSSVVWTESILWVFRVKFPGFFYSSGVGSTGPKMTRSDVSLCWLFISR